MNLDRAELQDLIRDAVQSDLRELVTARASASYALWERKTLNIHRGVVFLQASSASSTAEMLLSQVRDTVSAEFNLTWSWLRGFGFGAVVYSRSFPSDIEKILGFIDRYNSSRGVFQWLIHVTDDLPMGFGTHMWAEGYLSGTYRRLIALLQARGMDCPSFVQDKGAFFSFLQSIGKLGTPTFQSRP
jgi:hypothetical protein